MFFSKRRILTTVLRMTASATSSETLSWSELPKYVSMAWLKVSNAPERTCMGGTDMVYAGSRTANTGAMPKMPPFHFFSSWVMTPPAFISAPVPDAVTTAPTGIPALGNCPLPYSISQMSSSSRACAEITLQQSITLPPPTARMKSTCCSRAMAAPSCTFA